jgi:hypothetical protein
MRTNDIGLEVPVKEPLPELAGLHLRHPGLTIDLCRAYAEAAGVCLSRHHTSPIEMSLTGVFASCRRQISWQAPTERAIRAWANRDDATRDGAYSLSLAAVEAEYGLTAITRADTRTGADFYVAPYGEQEDLENAHRLEVSGLDQAGESRLRSRLRRKIAQVERGNASGPSLVIVVGFSAGRIAMAEVGDIHDQSRA